jgi:hypothetical protein
MVVPLTMQACGVVPLAVVTGHATILDNHSEKMMWFHNLLSRESHRYGGYSDAAAIYKDIYGLAGLGITCVR